MSTTRQSHQKRVLDSDSFARLVQQKLRALAHISTLDCKDLDLTLQIYGAPVRVNLLHAYHEYLQDSAQLESILATLVKSAQGFKPDYLIKDFAVLSPHIYPMLKPFELLSAVREGNLPLLAYRPFLANLMITYVIDEQDSVAYINEHHLACWQIDRQILHTQAMANLRQRTAQTAYTSVGEGAQRLFLFHSQDGYDAARLLLSDVLEMWATMLPDHMVVGIPNRDLLVAFSDSNRALFSRVARQIQLDRMSHRAGLTDQLFTLVDGIVCTYTGA